MPLTHRAVDRARIKRRSTASSRSSLTSSSSTVESGSQGAATMAPRTNPQSHLVPRRRFLDLAIAATGLTAEAPFEVFAALEEREKLNFFQADATPLGTTEDVKNDHNPNFVTSFPVICESEADRAKCVRIIFYERRKAVVGPKPKPDVLCFADFVISDLLASEEKCLNLPMHNKYGREDDTIGSALVSGEEFRSTPTSDMVTLGFGGDSSADMGGPDGRASSFFVVSRELPTSPGHWKRVYRSPTFKAYKGQSNNSGSTALSGPLGFSSSLYRVSSRSSARGSAKSANLSGSSTGSVGGGLDFRLETSKISSRSLYGNNCDTAILLEYYQVRPTASRPADPVLCAHAKTSMNQLQKHMFSGRPIHMKCETGSWMQKAHLHLEQGSLVSTAEGDRKVVLLTASKFSFFRSEEEYNAHLDQENYVEKDTWARKKTTIHGKAVSMTWRGSSFTTDVCG